MKTLSFFHLFLTVILFFGENQLLAQSKKQVLFIGNSYTAGNNLPQMVYDVAISAGDTVVFDSNTPGGMTFQGHTTNATTILKIQSGNWDFVVLQEQSQRPSFSDAQVQVEVFPYAAILDSIINEYNPCAETMFYMTWGRKNGDASNCAVWPPVCTYEGMDSLLYLRYMMMGQMNDAVVSPVGAVWRHIRTHHPSLELYQSDDSHPSLAGTYAAAVCFYTCVFRKDPTNVTFSSTLDAADALAIRNAVKTVVYDSLSKWYIDAYDPVAGFTSHISGNTVNFTNTSEFADDFLWDFGDGNFSSDEHPANVFVGNGNYSVTLFASHCSYTDTLVQTVVVTGFEEYENSLMLKIFPNPAGDELFFATNATLNSSLFTIYDFSGRIVFQGVISENTNLINIQQLHPGIYFLEIQCETTANQVLKFVKY
jgi:hypothetical protein